MSYEDRFLKRAANAGPAFGAAVKSYLGFAPADAAKLLDIASKLSHADGRVLDSNDINTLVRLHPQMQPRDLGQFVHQINALPSRQRADAFLSVLASDHAAMQGNFVDAGQTYKQLQALSEAYTTTDMSDAINAKLKGTDAPPAWRPEQGSVRDLVERAVIPQEQRNVKAAFDSGNPDAEDMIRHRLADRLEASINTLREPDLSTRDALGAAFDLHQGEQFAAEELGVTPGDN